MRIGMNPEKTKNTKLIHKPHRVIIPVYIPNTEEDYYKNSLAVLKLCLDSLIATINPDQTNITIINNASCSEVDKLLESYHLGGHIQKYVKLAENRGKVEPVLSEAMASYEDYITISDADVLFQNGWLQESMKLFDMFSPAVVMPLPVPNNFSMNNLSCFNKAWLTGKLKFGKVVAKDDLILFEESIGTTKLMERFYNKQYYIEKNGVKACLGAGHFVATYNRKLFDFINRSKKVEFVFKSGGEREYLDNLSKTTGTCRLSTIKPYVYHMGNTVPNREISFEISDFKQNNIVFPDLPALRRRSYYSQLMNRILYKIYRIYANRFFKEKA